MISRLLIAGIPGTGKTNIGNYLAAKHDFIHIDMESGNNIPAIIKDPTVFIENLVDKKKDIVVTWGFVPCEEQIGIVKQFKNKFFKLVWFDGNRAAAKREYIKREEKGGVEYLTNATSLYDLQISRIDGSGLINRICPSIVNTFNDQHEFKGLDQIFNEIKCV